MYGHSHQCRLVQRIYYRPIEAAILSSGLIDKEADILLKINYQSRPTYDELCEWPSVFNYNERIYDAIINKELPSGRKGVTCDIDPADQELTVRHIDLKRWISDNYPFEKPAFLFNEEERRMHVGIDIHALQLMLTNNSLLNQSIDHKNQAIADLETKCKAIMENPPVLKERSENTYLCIIGAMLDILVNDIHANFPSQESIIDALLTQYPGHPGLSERTLKSKFAAAKRKISTKSF
ncbi:hypothetical protein [Saezia sanguinis]|uniref:hypothetical protein n=1 Tax=Saezia sanguinis TaxID=1965230 RepID=UPI00304B84A0